MSIILLCIAVVLFLFAGIIAVAGGSIGISVLGLVAFGLAAFAAASLPLP